MIDERIKHCADLCDDIEKHGHKAYPCNGYTAIRIWDTDNQWSWMSVNRREVWASSRVRIDPTLDLWWSQITKVRDFRYQVQGWIIFWESPQEAFPNVLTGVVFN